MIWFHVFDLRVIFWQIFNDIFRVLLQYVILVELFPVVFLQGFFMIKVFSDKYKYASKCPMNCSNDLPRSASNTGRVSFIETFRVKLNYFLIVMLQNHFILSSVLLRPFIFDSSPQAQQLGWITIACNCFSRC